MGSPLLPIPLCLLSTISHIILPLCPTKYTLHLPGICTPKAPHLGTSVPSLARPAPPNHFFPNPFAHLTTHQIMETFDIRAAYHALNLANSTIRAVMAFAASDARAFPPGRGGENWVGVKTGATAHCAAASGSKGWRTGKIMI